MKRAKTLEEQTENVPLDYDERYRLLAEVIPHFIWRADASGKRIEANRRWSSYTDCTPEQGLGFGWMEALHPDDRPVTFERIHEATRTGVLFEAEYRIRRADGTYRWHLARALPTKNEQGEVTGWAGTAIDIDDQKQAEEALRRAHDELEVRVAERTLELAQSEQRYRTLVETSPDAIIMADLQGRITFASHRAATLYGCDSVDELIGSDPRNFLVPEEHDKWLADLERAAVDGLSRNIEYTLLKKDGTRYSGEVSGAVIKDASGKPLALMALVRDVTERKKAAEAILRAKIEWERTFDSVQDLITVLDTDCRIVRVNRAQAERLGLTTQECVGLTCHETIHGLDAPPTTCPHALTQLDGKPHTCEIHEDRLGGDFLVTTTPLTDEREQIIGSVHVARDITERKKAEQQLQKEHRTLKHLLLSSDHDRQTIAYEIHDSLAQQLAGAIMQFQTFTHLKDTQPSEAANAFDAGQTMLRQAHYEARRLISGVRPPILDESGVVTAVAHLVNEHRRRKGPKIELHSEVDFDRLSPTTENTIYRIVYEALTNAVSHSKSRRVRVGMVQRGDNLQIKVQDWGVGFDPKSVAPNRFGLEGIRERARLLGGQAIVDTTIGRGTCLVVDLPLVTID